MAGSSQGVLGIVSCPTHRMLVWVVGGHHWQSPFLFAEKPVYGNRRDKVTPNDSIPQM